MALMPVFRNVLRVKLDRVPAHEKKEVLLQLREEFGLDVSSFLEILGDKKFDGKIGTRDAESFLNDFLIQLERLSEIVDNM